VVVTSSPIEPMTGRKSSFVELQQSSRVTEP
jgi:hypothetical protein